MKYKYAVTHPGQCHRDDAIASALLLALGTVTVINRRNPTPEELDDPEVIVFDVGNRHEPEKSNFDHHQLPAKAEPDCALWMVMRHLGHHDALADLFSWYGVIGMLDSKGPFKFAESVGTRWEAIAGLMGPFEEYLMRKFGTLPAVDASTAPWLVEMGREIVRDLDGFQAFLLSAPEKVQEIEVDGVPGLLAPELSPVEVSKYLSIWRRRRQLERRDTVFAFSVTRDDRGPGLTLYRYADDPRISCAVLAHQDGVTFAHAGGFIAKTAKADVGKAKALLKLSVK